MSAPGGTDPPRERQRRPAANGTAVVENLNQPSLFSSPEPEPQGQCLKTIEADGITFFGAGQLGDSPPQNVTVGAKTPKSGAQRVADYRRRKRARTEAMLWSRPDWRLFIDVRTLPQKAGCLPGDIRRAVVKEIVDNGLDNGGGATIEAWNDLAAYRGYVIRDNGPGIDPKKVAHLFCVNRDLVSSKLRRAPLRGMLGNGLRVVMGAVAASNGILIVETRGRRLTLSVDTSTGRTCVDKNDVVRRTPGTAVYIALGEPITFDGTEEDFGERIISCGCDGVQSTVRSSPHWYSARDLHALCAHVQQDTATVGDIVQNLGFQRDDNRSARSITLDEAKAVLAGLQSTVKAPSPADLGYMGPGAFRTPGYHREIGHRSIGGATIPYVIEVWAAACRIPEDRRGQGSVIVETLINRTVCLDGVAGACLSGSISVFGCGLERYSTIEKAPTADYSIIIGLISPLIDLASDGKRPDLAPFRRQIAVAVGKAARKAFAVLDKPERSMSIIDAASEVMLAAYMKASDNGKLPANPRQIMYAARPEILRLTGKRALDDRYFTQRLLPNYVEANPDICSDWDIVWDARGSFIEPHTGVTIGIGTIEVRSYVGDRPLLWPAVSLPVDDQYPTAGPKNRYRNILFIEKEGFEPLLRASGIAERFDLAIMSTKGMSTTAARMLIDRLAPDTKVFALHDLDLSGITILGTLGTDGRRYTFDNSVNIVDIGLRLDDVERLGLDSEPVVNSGDWSAHSRTLHRHGATPEEIDFLQDRRVELNALTSRQFIDFIEAKLVEHGVTKVIPDNVTLESHARRLIEQRLAKQAIEKIRADLERQSGDMELPADLREQVEAELDGDPSLSWDAAEAAVIEQWLDAADDAADSDDSGKAE